MTANTRCRLFRLPSCNQAVDFIRRATRPLPGWSLTGGSASPYPEVFLQTQIRVEAMIMSPIRALTEQLNARQTMGVSCLGDSSSSGDEPGFLLPPSAEWSDRSEQFDLRPPTVSPDADPVYDEATGFVVGYRDTHFRSVRYYDLEGKVVGMEEPGLEAPLLDPLDAVLFGAGLIQGLTKGLLGAGARSVTRAAAGKVAARLTTRVLASSISRPMMATFRGLTLKRLQFTATTARHMATKGRRVPIHILHLAVKHGRRSPDPKGVKGAFMYYSTLHRNGAKYTLEVLVREKDYTILHFLYK